MCEYTCVHVQVSDPGQAHGQTISTLLLMLTYLKFVIFYAHAQLCVQNFIRTSKGLLETLILRLGG